MRIKVLLILLLFSPVLFSQTGGDNTYEFLNLSTHSLISSLGGTNVSLDNNDPSLALYNPSILKSESSGALALNYGNYLAGINYGSAIYALDKGRLGTFAAGINYLNYGKFDRTNTSGAIIGSFRASEYALNLLWSYRIDSVFRAGINLKPVFSHLDNYNSFGLLLDIGAHYSSKDGLYSAGLVIRNFGTQITSYTGIYDKVPFEIILGASAKLAHAPFRFSLTARHLERYDLIHQYLEPDQHYATLPSGIEEITENIMRHLIFGVEFIPSQNFYVSGGFNYQRRKELALESRTSTVGLSLGAGIKLSSFDLSISRTRYHLAGSLTNISLLLKPAILRGRN